MANVPRVTDITGKQSREDAAAERDWQRTRQRFRNDNFKHAYGTPEAKAAWLRRINKTRSA